jgi:hypothetical protein
VRYFTAVDGCLILQPIKAETDHHMKHQYFGDINDYKKYGLLRILAGRGQMRTAVCWMLTTQDGRADGKFTTYLQAPNRWRAFDPDLFDLLAQGLGHPEQRHVRWAETAGLLPGAVFYPRLLTDNAAERQEYFQRFLTLAQGSDLVFFDPDNGLEVKSTPYGRKDSCKFLYWPELQATFRAGHSVCVYQHFPRVDHHVFITTITGQIYHHTGAAAIITFRTARVLFVLIPQPHQLAYFQRQSQEVERKWGSQIITQTAGY